MQIDADARPAVRGGSSLRKPVLVVTAYFVDAVEARLKQEFELRRKKNGAHFTPEELLSAKNTFLLPQLGAATIETRMAMGMLALDNIDAVLGRPAPSLVPMGLGSEFPSLSSRLGPNI